jgi:hypothetical protein
MNHEDPEDLRRSINCIVILLQTELDDLLQQKATNKLRLRTLRRHLASLRNESCRRPSARSKYRRLQDGRAQAAKLRQAIEELRRACRIAFLELGGSATAHELYLAITRRESFSFAAIKEEPIVAIIRTLTSMAKSGEATCGINGSRPKWTHNTQASPFQWLS